MKEFQAALRCTIMYHDFFGQRKYIRQGSIVTIREIPAGCHSIDLNGMHHIEKEITYQLLQSDHGIDVFPEEFEENLHT